MNNIVVRDQRGVEAYRKRIFKSKEKCRRIFAKESFDKKIEAAFELYKQAEYLKKFKAARPIPFRRGPAAHHRNRRCFIALTKET